MDSYTVRVTRKGSVIIETSTNLLRLSTNGTAALRNKVDNSVIDMNTQQYIKHRKAISTRLSQAEIRIFENVFSPENSKVKVDIIPVKVGSSVNDNHVVLMVHNDSENALMINLTGNDSHITEQIKSEFKDKNIIPVCKGINIQRGNTCGYLAIAAKSIISKTDFSSFPDDNSVIDNILHEFVDEGIMYLKIASEASKMVDTIKVDIREFGKLEIQTETAELPMIFNYEDINYFREILEDKEKKYPGIWDCLDCYKYSNGDKNQCFVIVNLDQYKAIDRRVGNHVIGFIKGISAINTTKLEQQLQTKGWQKEKLILQKTVGSPQTDIANLAKQPDPDISRPTMSKALIDGFSNKKRVVKPTEHDKRQSNKFHSPTSSLQTGSTTMQEIRKIPTIGCLRQDTSNINPKPAKLPKKPKQLKL